MIDSIVLISLHSKPVKNYVQDHLWIYLVA